MKNSMTLTIQGLPKIISNGSKGSWLAAWGEAKKWHRLVLQAVVLGGHIRDVPMQKAKLKLTRHSSMAPDFDGLCSSFKHVIDGLIKAGVIADDKVTNVGQPIYDWKKCAPKKGFITIELWEVSE